MTGSSPPPRAQSIAASSRRQQVDSLFAENDRVAVLLPRPVGTAYDYRVPAGLVLAPGDIVEVPLGPSRARGVVWGADSGEIAAERLKDVGLKLDVPPVPQLSRDFVDWVAAYTLSPPGAVLRMVLSVPDALEPPRVVTAYQPPPAPPGIKMTPAREKVLTVAREGPPRSAADLAREAGVTPGVIRKLADLGGLVPVSLAAASPPPQPDLERAGPLLSNDQQAAASTLEHAVNAEAFSVHVLDGVTGSGKTEVYFQAMAAALQAGRQVLVLLPEIALSTQWLERFEARFGTTPALWHSEVTQAQRRATWRHVADGSAQVIVGARSALFLPYHDLGLIVVDEEHDPSFKQEDGVIYNARDMAIVRARLGDHPVILASATPALETLENVLQGRYQQLKLTARHGGAALPEISAIDLKKSPPMRGRWLSPPLVAAVSETLERREQALLFLNRRGYAPLTLCRSCGHRFQCPQCTAWLVDHRLLGRLQCHHCGLSMARPTICPVCEAEDSLHACGPGVERLQEEAQALFPEARIAVAASDTLTSPKALRMLIEAIQAHEVDLIIGTQVVAKGHHFPLLTLVGVVDADLGLSGGDLRASERTFQMLQQVSGRAGRAERAGRVLLQTHLPEHPVLQALAAGDRDGFLEAERAGREVTQMPPFGRLVALIVSGTEERAVDQAAHALGRAAPHGDGVHVLGPAPAPLALLRGRHRRRLLLKAPRTVRVQGVIRDWISRTRLPKKVRVQVDVDPYSFL